MFLYTFIVVRVMAILLFKKYAQKFTQAHYIFLLFGYVNLYILDQVLNTCLSIKIGISFALSVTKFCFFPSQY